MNKENLKKAWKNEEKIAHIHGWDFSHIHNRYSEETDLPWDYRTIIHSFLKEDHQLLDIDTGGGEFLLTLNHSYHLMSCTEGYDPNIEICKKLLLPLGIHFKEAKNAECLPFLDNTFDIIINRHGDYDPKEIYRLLKNNGIFITEQVGKDNDQDIIQFLYPHQMIDFHGSSLKEQLQLFKNNHFQILKAQEAFRPIYFYDTGAFVWYAHIIEWEFPNFSVDRFFNQLLSIQNIIDEKGYFKGTIHRYIIVAKKISHV